MILGEHGDSMVPIWSAHRPAGCRSRSSPAGMRRTAEALFKRTRGSGAEVIKLKGGAGFAVGLSIRDVDPRDRARPEADPAGLVAGQWHLRDPRRLHLGPDRRRPQGGRGPARDRALAQGNLGVAALGARCSARPSTRSSRAIPRRAGKANRGRQAVAAPAADEREVGPSG